MKLALLFLSGFSLQISQAAVVSHWQMNEASGIIADSSGNGISGTPSAAGLTYGQPSVAQGTYGSIAVSATDAANFGTAIAFNRSQSGSFDVGNPSLIGSLAEAGPTGQFSVTAWVNANIGSNSSYRVFSTGNGGVSGWAAGLSNVDQVILTTNGIKDMRSANAPSANNVWQHVAWTWNAGAVEIFVNGVSVFTDSSGFNNETASNYRIGGNPNGQDMFNGLMDDVKIHNIALDQAGVIASATPVPEPSSTALLGLGGLALILRRKK